MFHVEHAAIALGLHFGYNVVFYFTYTCTACTYMTVTIP